MKKRNKTIADFEREDHNRRLVDLESHADVANREMGEVKEHLGVLETDVKWLKEALDKIDTRTWYILGTIILGTLIQIILKLK